MRFDMGGRELHGVAMKKVNVFTVLRFNDTQNTNMRAIKFLNAILLKLKTGSIYLNT